jgi:hypothetical protein
VTVVGKVVGIVDGKTEPRDGGTPKAFKVVSLLQQRQVEGGTSGETVAVKFWNGAAKGIEMGKDVTLQDVVIRAYVPSRGGSPVLSADVFGN